MNFDIESFHVFNTVVEQGSFARAAEKLQRAQSAISYQIKKLEQKLGADLFDRSHYRAELTPAGRAILSEGRRLLVQVKHIGYLAERYKEGWEPSLEMVIDGALPMDPVMSALKILTEKDIPTRIQLKVEFLGGVQQRFTQDEADIMLVKDFIASPGLISEPLPTIENILVVAKSHPLATKKGITRRELQEFVELTINDSSNDITKLKDAHQFGGDKIFYLSGFVYKKHALLMSLGFGWMPKFLIQEELANGNLIRVDYEAGSEYTFTPLIVSTDYKPLGKAGLLLKSLILDEFNKA
jgi:DNA-binding transcriptional LysR family regulator